MKMLQNKNAVQRTLKITLGSLLITGLLIAGSTPGFSANKSETIDATAMGTSTQMGSQFSITLNVYDYSSQTDKQILVDAFQKGGDQGLVNALSKMKAAAYIEGAGNLGKDYKYIQKVTNSTGRHIYFFTNRNPKLCGGNLETRSDAL